MTHGIDNGPNQGGVSFTDSFLMNIGLLTECSGYCGRPHPVNITTFNPEQLQKMEQKLRRELEVVEDQRAVMDHNHAAALIEQERFFQLYQNLARYLNEQKQRFELIKRDRDSLEHRISGYEADLNGSSLEIERLNKVLSRAPAMGQPYALDHRGNPVEGGHLLTINVNNRDLEDMQQNPDGSVKTITLTGHGTFVLASADVYQDTMEHQEARIAVLEAILEQNGIEIPGSEQEDNSSTETVVETDNPGTIDSVSGMTAAETTQNDLGNGGYGQGEMSDSVTEPDNGRVDITAALPGDTTPATTAS